MSNRMKSVCVRMSQSEWMLIYNLADMRGTNIPTLLRMLGIAEARKHGLHKVETKRARINANDVEISATVVENQAEVAMCSKCDSVAALKVGDDWRCLSHGLNAAN